MSFVKDKSLAPKDKLRKIISTQEFDNIDDSVISKMANQLGFNIKARNNGSYKDAIKKFFITTKNFSESDVKQIWDIFVNNFNNINDLQKFLAHFGIIWNTKLNIISAENKRSNWAKALNNKTIDDLIAGPNAKLYKKVILDIMNIDGVRSGNVSGKGEAGIAIITNGKLGDNTSKSGADIYFGQANEHSTEVKFISSTSDIPLVPSKYTILAYDEYYKSLPTIIKNYDSYSGYIDFILADKLPNRESIKAAFLKCKTYEEFADVYCIQQINYYFNCKQVKYILIYNGLNQTFYCLERNKFNNEMLNIMKQSFILKLPRNDSRHRALNIRVKKN